MQDPIYLDNAATTYPKPREVYDFMHEFYSTCGGNPDRTGRSMAGRMEQVVSQTRKMLCELFGGDDPRRLTFCLNASDALNQIVQGMLASGDHVVTTLLEHNSVLRPLYHKEQAGEVEVTYVPFDDAGFVSPADVKAALRENTKLVLLNHASNVVGTVQPLGEVGRACREAGAYFAVDASQTAGVVEIDAKGMCIDLVAFTGHKGLMGPTGIGGVYTGEGVPIRATRFGGTGVQSGRRTHPEEFPYRLECGTLNILGVAGLYAGQLWLREQGVANVHAREMALWDRMRRGLQGIEGVVTYCADGAEGHTAVLSFNVLGWEAADVGAILDANYGIACRTGLHCAPLVHRRLGTDEVFGTVRFSLGPFNTEEQVERAVAAVAEIAAIKG
ncbi:MAG: aminotransferase class V-fold PLP-dependent enzyme [Acidobacteriota bacterium]|jgi:cysteine desulfurase family protein|nr:aminotransferase class V-fold PLP-dependent enzyme [Acidobacteriota bacterium]